MTRRGIVGYARLVGAKLRRREDPDTAIAERAGSGFDDRGDRRPVPGLGNAFFAEQSRLTGRPVFELATESAARAVEAGWRATGRGEEKADG